jgi:hypothetical protein
MDLTSLSILFNGITASVAVFALGYAVRQVKEARKARVLSAYLTFESRLTSPQARQDRRFIYEKNLDSPATLTPEEREIIERVCVPFDILGVLVREDLMYRPLVFKPFYDVIIKYWIKTFDFICYERNPGRKFQTYMQDFQYLYDQSEEFRRMQGYPEIKVH